MTSEPTWPDLLTRLVTGSDLDASAVEWAMGEILEGNASPVQIAGFAVALRSKGETVEEISALSDAMLSRATPIALDPLAVDVVGSGGDRSNSVNVSTMAAIVAAGMGAKVVKHGNRSASSASGAADCLEALGVVLDISPESQQLVLDEAGIVFMFAPLYHPSLRHAGLVRRELGISTTFNFLGPLSNPARPIANAVGVADARMAALMAGVLAARGGRGLVFHGADGLDELTTTTTSDVWMFDDGRLITDRLDPNDLGIARTDMASLRGGDPSFNAAVVRDLVAGATGPVRDIVVLNAAAAGLAYTGFQLDAPIADQMVAYVRAAEQAIDSGRAAQVLDTWVTITQRLASER